MTHQYSPMACQNCALRWCSSNMLLDGIHEHPQTPNDPPRMPLSHQQEREWLNFPAAPYGFALGTVDAPNNSCPREPFVDLQSTVNSFDGTHHGTSAHRAQPAGHQAEYRHPTVYDARSPHEQMWGHRHGISIEATSGDRQGSARSDPEVLRCQWKDCTYTRAFGRPKDLMRHIETQHVSPKAYKCWFPGCGKEYNRDDNLRVHLRKAHGSSRPRR